MARPEDRPAVFLAFAGVAFGVLALVLPLYASPTGGSTWFLGQFSGAPLSDAIGFALPSIGLLLIAVAAGISLAARTSRKVAAGVFLALGAFAFLTVASRFLLVSAWDGRALGLLGLTALEGLCFVLAGWLASRPVA